MVDTTLKVGTYPEIPVVTKVPDAFYGLTLKVCWI
jgi:hypothetical protein